MGDALADEVQRVLTEQNISADVVIPVRGDPADKFSSCSVFRSGPRYISCRCAEPSPEIETPLPGGVHQESIRWANVHHARSTDEVGRAQRPCHPCLIPTTHPGVRMSAKS